MANFYSQPDCSGDMYTPAPPSSLPLQTENLQGGEPAASNLLTTSLLLANGMDGMTSTEMGLPLDTTWSSAPMSTTAATSLQLQCSFVVTPPPEMHGFPPAYPYPTTTWQDFTCIPPPIQPIASSMAPTTTVTDCYLKGSSIVDSPLSSPGSTDSSPPIHEMPDDLLYGQTTSSKSPSPLCYNVYSHPAIPAAYEPTMNGYSRTMAQGLENNNGIDFSMSSKFAKEPRMPQRKGGIQLWQFLYTLLTDADKKYRDIIEWTAKAHEKEFRMLEPESIAIWWGHHKNKPSMTYDKFSRSLRYYYDKGILKKIPGERYVYRFLIDPELMYHHIGTSDCRPKVKPMPQAAKSAMSKFNKSQNLDFKDDLPIVTQEARPLEESVTSIKTSVVQNGAGTTTKTWMSPSSSNSLQVTSTNLQTSSSTGNLLAKRSACFGETSGLPIKRSRSLESYSDSSSDFTQTNSIGFLPSSCPPVPFASELPHMHSVVSHMNKVGSHNNFIPLLCDSYYPMPTTASS